MLLWQQHRPLPESTVQEIEADILDACGGKLEGKYYTTYPDHDGSIEPQPRVDLKGFYADIQREMCQDMGLNFGPRAVDPYWFQMYNSDCCTTHELHDHWRLDDKLMCIISWVHIIKDVPQEQDCFYFATHTGKQLSPQPQSSGWVFAFPSWAPHGVRHITTPGVNRIICAGNLSFKTQKNSLLSQQQDEELAEWLESERKLQEKLYVPD